jgi:phenylpyruvate tautomerase PptA (4-oxalocrotonate tautomerase family)
MAQVKVYGLRGSLSPRKQALSEAIHEALIEAFGLPRDKRFQRFIALDPEDFVFPHDRSERYTIVEISVFEGRSPEAKRRLIMELFARVGAATDLSTQDLEITIFETPRTNWGIRGKPGDELSLGYAVNI